MRFTSYYDTGRARLGVMDGEHLIAPLPNESGPHSDMRAMLEKGLPALIEAGAKALAREERLQFEELTLLPLVPDAHAIWCAAGTFRAHLKEGNHKETSEPAWFLRVRDSLCAHRTPIVKPRVSDRLDYEGELAVIIGREARHVAEKDAASYIAGYSCFNDASVRDWQVHTSQITPGKNFSQTGSVGPWLVTPDEFEDPYAKRMETFLNKEKVQSAPLSDLIFSIEKMISYLSTICRLYPGDIIATGTCAGVGNRRNPQLFMKDGDVVTVRIEGVGELINPIKQEI